MNKEVMTKAGELMVEAGQTIIDQMKEPAFEDPERPDGELTKIEELAGRWDEILPPDFNAPTPLHNELVHRLWAYRVGALESWLLDSKVEVWPARRMFLLALESPGETVTNRQLISASLMEVWTRRVIGDLKKVWFDTGPGGAGGSGRYHVIKFRGNPGLWAGAIRELEQLGHLEDLAKWEGWETLEATPEEVDAELVDLADTPDPRKFRLYFEDGKLFFAVDVDRDGEPLIKTELDIGETLEKLGAGQYEILVNSFLKTVLGFLDLD